MPAPERFADLADYDVFQSEPSAGVIECLSKVGGTLLVLGAGGKMGRGAGASIQLVAKEGDYATLRMPSTEMRRVMIDCRATVGEVGNSQHELVKIKLLKTAEDDRHELADRMAEKAGAHSGRCCPVLSWVRWLARSYWRYPCR